MRLIAHFSFLSFLLVALAVPGQIAFAQVDSFATDFSEDPLASGELVFNGSAIWISPDADECFDENAGVDDDGDGLPDGAVNGNLIGPSLCTIAEGEGYILVTPAENDRGGAAWFAEPASFDNFKMVIEVELRNGSVGRPADGMTVVLLEDLTGAPPGLGGGGGGMGATGLGNGKTMVFEFDNWSGNNGDSNNGNHLAFAWEPFGIPAGDAIQPDAFAPIDPVLYPLHNQTCGNDGNLATCPAEANRYEMTVFVQKGTVAANLKRTFEGNDEITGEDNDDDLGRIYTYTIPDYESFTGFLGVTGSTGGARQNHILHSVSVEALPPGFCLQPPAIVDRRITGERDSTQTCGDFADGDDVSVELEFVRVREADENCSAPDGIVIEDTAPEGWEITAASDGGTINGNTVTFTVPAAEVAEGKIVSYTVRAADSGNLTESFAGTLVEDVPLSEVSQVTGQNSVTKDTAFDECGGIRCWNILGPYAQPSTQTGNNPGQDNMRADYLTDGETEETDFIFFPGAQIATQYGGDGVGDGAKSTGLRDVANEDINPGGVPTVYSYNHPGATFINLNDDVYGGDPNDCMSYSQIYIVAEEEREVGFQVSSDDSIQVLLNGEEIWNNSVARGGSGPCAPQDIVDNDLDGFADLFPLEEGANSLIVKTFEGGGGFNYAVVMTDEDGLPIISEDTGISASKFPEGVCPQSPLTAVRTIDTGGATVPLQHSSVSSFELETTYPVSIALSNPRASGPICDAAEDVSIVERVPEAWSIESASNGGDIQGARITWNLKVSDGLPAALTYEIKSPDVGGAASWSGSVADTGSDVGFAVSGDNQLSRPSGFEGDGFVSRWLLLGPYTQPISILEPAANPGENAIRQDHLTDGDGIDEIDVEPVSQDFVNTDFGGAARSTGLAAPIGAVTEEMINPGGVPTWKEWYDANDTINFADYYGGDGVDNVMMYAVTYVNLEEDMTLNIGVASDDSIQVLLDGEEIWINNIPRGGGAANEIQDTIFAIDTPALDPLTEGCHKITVKVFEGGGGHNFRLSFRNEIDGTAMTEGITVFSDPDCGGDVQPREICDNTIDDDGDGDVDCADDDCEAAANCQVTGGKRVPGDCNADGAVNISDPVCLLGFLFQGNPTTLPCGDGSQSHPANVTLMDGNGDSAINLSDAIFFLTFLFNGGPPHPLAVPGSEQTGCVEIEGCTDACNE